MSFLSDYRKSLRIRDDCHKSCHSKPSRSRLSVLSWTYKWYRSRFSPGVQHRECRCTPSRGFPILLSSRAWDLAITGRGSIHIRNALEYAIFRRKKVFKNSEEWVRPIANLKIRLFCDEWLPALAANIQAIRRRLQPKITINLKHCCKVLICPWMYRIAIWTRVKLKSPV